MAVNSAAGNMKFMTSALSEPMLRLSISLVRPTTKPRIITRNKGTREANIVSIILRSMLVRRVDAAVADGIEGNLSKGLFGRHLTSAAGRDRAFRPSPSAGPGGHGEAPGRVAAPTSEQVREPSVRHAEPGSDHQRDRHCYDRVFPAETRHCADRECPGFEAEISERRRKAVERSGDDT
jgi:hypothetical protein